MQFYYILLPVSYISREEKEKEEEALLAFNSPIIYKQDSRFP